METWPVEVDALAAVRSCAHCGCDISHKRSHAQYCSRTCKTKGSDRRRVEDGRSAARDRERYAQHREKRLAAVKDYYWKNRDACVARARNYRRENPHRRRAYNEVRADHMRQNPGFVPFTAAEWDRMVNRFNHCCAYCGVRAERLDMDHVIPLSRGGRHAIANILPACPNCNRRKSGSLLSEWRYTRRGGANTPWIL